MKILVIGSGGREHALAWKLAQSPKASKVFVAPGNGGTLLDKRLTNLPITDIAALRDFALAEKIDMTVVGPEAPLAAGVVDVFRTAGLRIFGPTQAAAQLESSKAFSKDLMQRHGIPTAHYGTFSDAAAAHAYIEEHGAPIVVKADGLAAGKGVVVAMTVQEAHEAVDFMLLDNKLGVQHNAGGARVVIEEFLAGEEASFIVMSDGKHVAVMATSQDHKRLLDADLGPNTGGMGAYSPAPVVTPEVRARGHARIAERIDVGVRVVDLGQRLHREPGRALALGVVQRLKRPGAVLRRDRQVVHPPRLAGHHATRAGHRCSRAQSTHQGVAGRIDSRPFAIRAPHETQMP